MTDEPKNDETVEETAAETAETTEAPKPKAKAKAKAKPKPAAAEPEAEAPGDATAEEPVDEPAPKPAQAAAPTRRRDRRGGEQVIVSAHARYVRSSARKARLVSDNVRGKSVPEARAILAYSPRQIAEAWTKLLESAVANAENNNDLVGEDLKIHAIFADEGPTIKRYRPRAMGRATRIRKRTSHLTIQLTPKD